MIGHTKGPWRWDAGLVPPDGPQRYATIYAAGDPDLVIAEFNDSIPEGGANACLIAAAPDLLAALEVLVGQRDAHFHTTTAWDAARAAIARAKGDAP